MQLGSPLAPLENGRQMVAGIDALVKPGYPLIFVGRWNLRKKTTVVPLVVQ